jgi:hypothetical protein
MRGTGVDTLLRVLHWSPCDSTVCVCMNKSIKNNSIIYSPQKKPRMIESTPWTHPSHVSDVLDGRVCSTNPSLLLPVPEGDDAGRVRLVEGMKGARQTKITQLQMAVPSQQQIGQLEVPVHDPA